MSCHICAAYNRLICRLTDIICLVGKYKCLISGLLLPNNIIFIFKLIVYIYFILAKLKNNCIKVHCQECGYKGTVLLCQATEKNEDGQDPML